LPAGSTAFARLTDYMAKSSLSETYHSAEV